eukprot:COSAG02_NODE_2365_length_9052_cov_11.510779_3_plen_1026_part_00
MVYRLVWLGRSPESSGGYDELESFPNKVEIFAASVEGNLSDPSYIIKCVARPCSLARTRLVRPPRSGRLCALRRVYTAAGKAWGIKRKFSAIKNLRKSKEKEPAVMAIPFPERVEAVAGKDSVDATQSRQRQEAAQTWMNAVLELSPGDTDLAAFFAHDGSVRASYAQDVLGVSVSAAELAADKAGGDRRAGEALKEAMAATKMSDVESQPDRVVISEAVKRQGDQEKRTQTEVYTVYRMTVFAPDGEEWVIEKRFSAFKALRDKLLADGNPAVRSMTFPESAFLGSVQGQGMDDDVISKRQEVLEVWINEVLLFCPGNPDVGKFLQNPILADAEAKAKAEFEAAAKAAKAEKIKAQDDELNYHPNKVELLVIRVDGDIEDPAYIMKCTTPANEIWPIARRYSSFVQLQKDLIATGNPAIKGIFFPHKKMFSSFTSSFGSFFGSKQQPSGGPDSSESRERKEQLQAWIDEVVDLCPGDKLVSMFLAKDGSVSVDLAKQLGINLGVADEAAEQRKAAGKAMELEKERAAASSKLQSMDQMPSKISIVKAITRQGDPDQKTKTEIFTAYWVKVFLPDSDDTWVVEKRFQAFKTLRAKLLADGNPAIRSTEFPPSAALGSLTGQGLDVEVVHTRKRLLESWLNEALLVCCGDPDLAKFLDRSLAIPDAELNIPDDFEIVMVNPKQGIGDLHGKGNANDEDSSSSGSGSSDSDSEEEEDAAIATAAMATAMGESGATVQRSIYVCASKTKIRSGFAMDSAECGVLEEGQRVETLGYKVNPETGITRVALGSAGSSQPVCQGWVSEKSGAGSVILAVAPPLSYSVDEGGAVAYRNTPRMADRHQGAKAQPSEIIQVGERRISIGDNAADGEWVQNKANKLWLPVRFLVPQGTAPSSAASAESARAERVARLAMQEKAAAAAKAKAAAAASPSKLEASSAASLEQSAKLKEAEAKAQADAAREKKEQEEREKKEQEERERAAAAEAEAEAAKAAAAAEAERAKAKEDEEDAIMARMLGTTGSDDEGAPKPQ